MVASEIIKGESLFANNSADRNDQEQTEHSFSLHGVPVKPVRQVPTMPNYSKEKQSPSPAPQGRLIPETTNHCPMESLVGTQDQSLHFILHTGL